MDILSSFKDIIQELLGVDPGEVTGESKFKEDLGADSLDIIELVMAAEDEFNISIPDAELDDLETVDQAIALVNRLRQE